MQLTRRALIAGLALLLSCGSAMAQYPDKPVRLVVPFPPGGPTDVFARVLSAGLAEQLGQQVLIDNKAGAGGTVGTDLVAKAKPDGYTLLFGTAATHGINISLYKTLPYDPLKDFELIALTGLVPMVLLVPPDQPRVLKELIAKLKSEPGKATYASSGNGTTNHLAGELFKSRAGIDAVHVPYRGSGPALQDLMGGRVTFMFDSFGTSLEQIKAGKLYAVAIMADKRSQARPDVPTTAEAGLRDFVGGTWNVVAAPAGTPKEIVDRLNVAINKALASETVADRLRQLGIEAVTDSTPASTRAFVSAEIVKWREVIRAAGAKVD
ncbi:Bug family tripartite tricarboxylate transporter substrate binding protein [Reyranella massiliensis]|uniref:Bug family tripartite tricarboxylate transporter substrate binding protein n=1 Tax=Reyranella massiliensis TaxID=445220 RepID=UPI0003001EA9|nr:tripartite tricarboxylate transporter substrate binding protein [Reyranella massiliensis]